MYGRGISREGSLLDVGVDLGIAKKSGAWYTYEGEQLGQGRENAKTFLSENLELMIEMSERVRQQGGIGGSAPRSRSHSRSSHRPLLPPWPVIPAQGGKVAKVGEERGKYASNHR